MHGQFQSRDKYSGQSLINLSRKPRAACKLCGSMFYRTAVITEGSVTLQEHTGIFSLFGSCDLELVPMTFMKSAMK